MRSTTRRSLMTIVLAGLCAATGACATDDDAAVPQPTSVANTTTSPSIPPADPAPSPTTAPEPPTTTATTAAPTTTIDPLDACVGSLDQRDRIALLVWPSVYADDWATARRVVADHQVGGVLLMRPRLNEAELRSRIAELDELSELGVLVATDEEGGDVQRLADIQPLPSQLDVSAVSSPDEARRLVAAHADMVDRVGVDVVLGPVIDVAPEEGRPPLQRSRFFAGGPAEVTAYGRAYVDGWASTGLTAVLKHFPGHGSASADTHLDAGFTPPLAELTARDLVPFADLADTGAAVMVGHLTVPGLTGDVPATFSPEAITHLREVLGYGNALVISDALDMAAAGSSVPDAAVASIAAGVDVVLFTSPGITGAVIDAIDAAVADGRVPPDRIDDAARRVLTSIEQHGGGCPS